MVVAVMGVPLLLIVPLLALLALLVAAVAVAAVVVVAVVVGTLRWRCTAQTCSRA